MSKIFLSKPITVPLFSAANPVNQAYLTGHAHKNDQYKQ
jgi:hypothetical protein